MKIDWFYRGDSNSLEITDWMDANRYRLPSEANSAWSDIEPYKQKYIHGIIRDSSYFSGKNMTISENAVGDVRIMYPPQEPDFCTMRVSIVYFANLYVCANGIDLVVLQMRALLDQRILEEVEHSRLFIVISADPQTGEQALDRLTVLFQESHVSPDKFKVEVHHDNHHEYPGILKVCMLSREEEEDREHIILYFHSKGITRFHGERDSFEQNCFDIVIGNWRWVLFIFTNFPSIDKVGITANEHGWLWHNFWWVRSSFAKRLEGPVKTERRHYYEDWIARELPPEINNGGKPIMSYDPKDHGRVDAEVRVSYVLRNKNCWNLLHDPPEYLNIGSSHSDMEAVHGRVF